MRTRGGVLAFGVGLLTALAIAPYASADTQITADPSAKNISAYGGVQAWQRKVPNAPNTFRLVIRRKGVVSDAKIDIFDHGIQADVGPDEDDHIVVVYSRCDKPQSFSNPDCGIYQYDTEKKRETRVEATRSDLQEVAPSIWASRYVYGRTKKFHAPFEGAPFDFLENDPLTGSGAGLFSNEQRLSSKPPRETDVYRKTVAWAPDANSKGDLQINVLRTDVKGSCEVAVNQFTNNLSLIPYNPVLDNKGNVWWLASTDTYDPVTNTITGQTFIYRRPIPSKTCKKQGSEQVAPLGQASSMAVDKGQVYYTDSTGVKKADSPKPF